MTIRRVYQFFLLVLLFILPFQSRWIYEANYLNGFFWEYGSFSWYGTEILLWIIVILLTYDIFSNRRNVGHLLGRLHFLSHKKNLYYILFFVSFLIVEVLISSNFYLSYNYLFRIIEALCLVLLLVVSGVRRKDLVLAFWAGAILQSIIGTYQFFSQHISANKWLGFAAQNPAIPGSSVIESGTERWLRAYGSFGSPNILGGYLAVALIFGLLLYLESRPFEKVFYTLGQVLILIGLILSFSRGAWVGAVVGFSTVGIILGIEGAKLKFSNLHIFFLFIKQMIFYSAVIIAAIILIQPLLAVRIKAETRLEVRSFSEREAQISEAFLIFKENWIFGTGLGTYTYETARRSSGLPGYAYQPVHNSFLLLLVECGIFGVLVFAFFFTKALRAMSLRVALPVLISIFTAALLDHYFVSLYSGQIILAAVGGLILAPKG